MSHIVTISYPDVTLNGAKFVTIPVGGVFVDSGASFVDAYTKEKGNLVADTGADVVPFDASTPGLYTLTYTAKNMNTFSTVVARYVAVTDYADLPAANISGSYSRVGTTASAKVSKHSRALYDITDFGGATLGNIGYFAIIDTNTIDFGEQYSETLGAFFNVDVKYFHIRPSDTSFQYALHAPGYGTAARTFKKK